MTFAFHYIVHTHPRNHGGNGVQVEISENLCADQIEVQHESNSTKMNIIWSCTASTTHFIYTECSASQLLLSLFIILILYFRLTISS